MRTPSLFPTRRARASTFLPPAITTSMRMWRGVRGITTCFSDGSDLNMAAEMNLELRQHAASGCKAIQVEEPTLHFMACYSPEKKDYLNFLVDAFNREIAGLDGVEVWIHTCWGNPNMQKVFTDESY